MKRDSLDEVERTTITERDFRIQPLLDREGNESLGLAAALHPSR
jgi:hypothetical protein